jgi:retron-type reverse transcriptase
MRQNPSRDINERIESKVAATNYIEDQYGFRRARWTRDAVSMLRCLGERSLENGKGLYICFVDYEKAFDRVNLPKLMEVLDQALIDKRDRELIKNLYMEETLVNRNDGKESAAAKIG